MTEKRQKERALTRILLRVIFSRTWRSTLIAGEIREGDLKLETARPFFFGFSPLISSPGGSGVPSASENVRERDFRPKFLEILRDGEGSSEHIYCSNYRRGRGKIFEETRN